MYLKISFFKLWLCIEMRSISMTQGSRYCWYPGMGTSGDIEGNLEDKLNQKGLKMVFLYKIKMDQIGPFFFGGNKGRCQIIKMEI